MDSFADSLKPAHLTGGDRAATLAADQAREPVFAPTPANALGLAVEQEWISPWKALLRDKHQFDADDVIDPAELQGVDEKHWPALIGLPNRAWPVTRPRHRSRTSLRASRRSWMPA